MRLDPIDSDSLGSLAVFSLDTDFGYLPTVNALACHTSSILVGGVGFEPTTSSLSKKPSSHLK